jgi:hemerythrin-like domain-containing protein
MTSKAIGALMHEHEIIVKVIDGLDRIAGALAPKRPADVELLRESVVFMRMFADKCHHGKEEDLLFPALVAAGVVDHGGPIGVMKSEHVQARECVNRFADAIERHARGETTARDDVVQAIDCLRRLYPQHILKENNVLFPMAERILTEKSLVRLHEAFEKVEERLGEDVHHRFALFAKRLENDTIAA